MLKGVGDGQGLTQGSYYLIWNSVPRDDLYSSRQVKVTWVQFTLTNICRAHCVKPSILRTLHCRDKQHVAEADILVTYLLTMGVQKGYITSLTILILFSFPSVFIGSPNPVRWCSLPSLSPGHWAWFTFCVYWQNSIWSVIWMQKHKGRPRNRTQWISCDDIVTTVSSLHCLTPTVGQILKSFH